MSQQHIRLPTGRYYGLDGQEMTAEESAPFREEDRKFLERAAASVAREEMAAFDCLGPQTRHVLSEAPVSLDARKLVTQAGVSRPVLRRMDAVVSGQLRQMLDAEYGTASA